VVFVFCTEHAYKTQDTVAVTVCVTADPKHDSTSLQDARFNHLVADPASATLGRARQGGVIVIIIILIDHAAGSIRLSSSR
jgi:hypothetical protein